MQFLRHLKNQKNYPKLLKNVFGSSSRFYSAEVELEGVSTSLMYIRIYLT